MRRAWANVGFEKPSDPAAKQLAADKRRRRDNCCDDTQFLRNSATTAFNQGTPHTHANFPQFTFFLSMEAIDRSRTADTAGNISSQPNFGRPDDFRG
jgi:hypothetical protein